MKDVLFEVIKNKKIADKIYEITLRGDTSECYHAGKFVNLKLEGFYLRRPISVCDVDGQVLTLIYKVIGAGTFDMTTLKEGDTVHALTGLGNGYNLDCAGDKPLLIGGGVGVPPLYMLAKELIERDKCVSAILGFAAMNEAFYAEKFKSLGVDVHVTTVDGSLGHKGLVTDLIEDIDHTFTYACGPIPMLRAISDMDSEDGEYSFEEKMGCGFGACMGCTHITKNETGNRAKRICKEGPVLRKGEIVWRD